MLRSDQASDIAAGLIRRGAKENLTFSNSMVYLSRRRETLKKSTTVCSTRNVRGYEPCRVQSMNLYCAISESYPNSARRGGSILSTPIDRSIDSPFRWSTDRMTDNYFWIKSNRAFVTGSGGPVVLILYTLSNDIIVLDEIIPRFHHRLSFLDAAPRKNNRLCLPEE